jgi:RNA polymerase sigma-70 factor (ECF subfamily)
MIAGAMEIEPLAPEENAAAAAEVTGLVERARAGEAAAFEALYRRFAPPVHGVLLARLAPADADEATHEVLVLAHARLAQLRAAEAFGPWVLSIARNVANDRLRARRRGPRTEPLVEEIAGPARGGGAGELRERVLHHIRGLPEAYQETLLLRLVEGLTGPEIATVTGLAPGSVRVNLHRGMELLRPLLKKDGWS